MAHLLQVGAGSGGMPVLDLVCRDERVTRLTLIEPDVYKPHNVHRHLFPASAAGRKKVELAAEWLHERRPDLDIQTFDKDLLDPEFAAELDAVAATADVAVCAADNEPAKYHFDALMRRHRVPWTLGEVLSGGIGGFVHWFVPGARGEGTPERSPGPCYGCVASHLKRSVQVDKPATPDYSQPGGAIHETTIPAGKAAISVIASLHALVTLQLLAQGDAYQPGFTSLLYTLERVPGVFEEAFRPFKFRVERSASCLVCSGKGGSSASGEVDLDAALDDALDRLGHA